MKRMSDEPAYVLHRYDWSETSLIVEVFSRHHGRIALVAKGAKRPTSSYRPVLLPLQLLRLGWSGDAEVRTLKTAEWGGGPVMPRGEALMAGFYLNELMMRLLARDDPHPSLFDHYSWVLQQIAQPAAGRGEALLRAFELMTLREVGVLPQLDLQTLTMVDVDPEQRYALRPDSGLMQAPVDERQAMAGAQWHALQQALDGPSPMAALLSVCEAEGAALKPLLRALLQYHCGGAVLRTRALMMEVAQL